MDSNRKKHKVRKATPFFHFKGVLLSSIPKCSPIFPLQSVLNCRLEHPQAQADRPHVPLITPSISSARVKDEAEQFHFYTTHP